MQCTEREREAQKKSCLSFIRNGYGVVFTSCACHRKLEYGLGVMCDLGNTSNSRVIIEPFQKSMTHERDNDVKQLQKWDTHNNITQHANKQRTVAQWHNGRNNMRHWQAVDDNGSRLIFNACYAHQGSFNWFYGLCHLWQYFWHFCSDFFFFSLSPFSWFLYPFLFILMRIFCHLSSFFFARFHPWNSNDSLIDIDQLSV